MIRTYRLLRLPNGKYLKSYQYSQGYLDHEETDVPWFAEDFSNGLGVGLAEKLFPGAVPVTATISCEITEAD